MRRFTSRACVPDVDLGKGAAGAQPAAPTHHPSEGSGRRSAQRADHESVQWDCRRAACHRVGAVDTSLNVYKQVIGEAKRAAAQKIGDQLFTDCSPG